MVYQNKEEFKTAFKAWLLENLGKKQVKNMDGYPVYMMNCYIRDLVSQWKETGKKVYVLPKSDSKTGENVTFNWEQDAKQ